MTERAVVDASVAAKWFLKDELEEETDIADDILLAILANDDRVLVTFNRKHFIRLHGQRPQHAGIIVCSVDPDPTALARRIHKAIGSAEDLSSRLVRVSRSGR